MSDRRARDHELLDLIDSHRGVAFEGDVWRIVRQERDVLQGYPAGARWDPGTFDVLYTALERVGALAEIHFHLSRQPVFPSKLRSVLHRLTVKTRRTLKIADLEALEGLGISRATFLSLSYERCQEVGDAAQFLGFDGILAPSARWPSHNLILFTDRLEPDEIQLVESEPVDWREWRETQRKKG